MQNKIEHIAIAPQNPAHLSPGDLLTEREAAAILNVAVKTLRNWRHRGENVRAVKIGRRLVRYRRADLTAFVDGQERAA